ncbi:MAG: hypothetical protein BGO43_07065 [Gammaproteobacteria bacterium 39-13]|nr:hypothetical protein [Gammaproteobacteria bacterium]OJV88348.1 MAG: hypothetical protein BGO43_07065 [Gammaproteobacteria bacterium 39-13]
MSLKKKFLMKAFCLLVGATNVVNAATHDETTYKNQRGSTLSLIWHHDTESSGKITGTFTTAVGNCQAEVGKPMPVTGYFSGNAITLSVLYPQCKKTIAMAGHTDKERSNMHTLWLVASASDDPRGKNWDANIVGSDTYQKLG